MKQKITEEIDVTCYSGHRLNEKPLSFTYKNQQYDIEKILSQTVEESLRGKIRLFRYSVLCQKNRGFTLIYNSKLDQWFVEVEISNPSNA